MNKGFTFIEIKTTGFNPVLDKICYISLTQFDTLMRARKSFSSWINPEVRLSSGASKFFDITNKELQEYPTFSEIASIIYPLIKDNTLGSFSKEVDVIEFLREELFMCDIQLKYLKKDFIVVKDLEEVINKRDVKTLHYKYTGKKTEDKEDYTKEIGEIFKYQCDMLYDDYKTFKYSKYIKNDMVEFTDKLLYEVDGILYLNFGKFKDTDVKRLPKHYITWIMDSDFPVVVKTKINEYLEK